MDNAKRRSDVRTQPRQTDDCLIVYDPRADNGFLLNASTAAVFEACDGRTTRAEMAERVAVRTGLPADVGIVDLALRELETSGLLLATETAPVIEAASVTEPTGVTRRTIMRRLALGAGALALLPMIDMVGGVSRVAADPFTAIAGEIPPLIAQDKAATTPPETPVDVTLSTTGGFHTEDMTTAFAVDTNPEHGTVAIVGAVATYTPDPGFTGTDTFAYIAWQCVALADALACPDGTGAFPETGSEPATVTITVAVAETTTTSPSTTDTDEEPAASTRPSFTG